MILKVWPQKTPDGPKTAIKKASNWKAPCKDGILTFVIPKRVYKRLDENNLLPKERRAVKEGAMVTKTSF